MKKPLLLLGFLLSFLCAFSQQGTPISQLPTYTGNPANGWVPVVIGTTTRKVDPRYFGYTHFDSLAISSGTTIDTFRFYNRASGVVFTSLYTKPSGSTIDTSSLSSRINLKVNLADTGAMLSPYQRVITAVKYTDTAAMLSPYLRSNVAAGTYATIANLALKVNISDTGSMLSSYLRKADTAAMLVPYLRSNVAAGTYATISNLALKVNISDTGAMLSPYLRKIDTTAMLSPYLRNNVAAGTYATITNDLLKVKYSDTAAMLAPYQRAITAIKTTDVGTVTNAMLAGIITAANLVGTDIATVGTITSGTWHGTVVGATYGGTGVNNGSNTITLAGNLVTSGAFPLTLTTTGSTNVTLPTSGTLVNTSVTTLSSLASISTITTGVWNGTVIAGQYGGTGVANTGKTITLGGNLTTSGAFATTLTTTATTSVTLPTSGTLYATGDTVSTLATKNSTPILLASGTVSSASTLDINMSAYYNLYTYFEVDLIQFIPQTTATDIWARVSTDGTTFDAGASNYRYAGSTGNDGSTSGNYGSTGDTKIIMNGSTNIVNGSSNGYNSTIKLWNPQSTALQPMLTWNGGYFNSSSLMVTHMGAGVRTTAQVTKGLRILFSSGNITSGKYRVWGYL